MLIFYCPVSGGFAFWIFFSIKTLTVEQMLGFVSGKLQHSRSITAFSQHHLVDRDFSWVVPVHGVLFFYLVFV